MNKGLTSWGVPLDSHDWFSWDWSDWRLWVVCLCHISHIISKTFEKNAQVAIKRASKPWPSWPTLPKTNSKGTWQFALPDRLPLPPLFQGQTVSFFRKDYSQNLLPRKPPVFSPQGLLVGHGKSDFLQKHDLHMQITSVVCTPFKTKRMCRNQSLWRIYLFYHRILPASAYIYRIHPNISKYDQMTIDYLTNRSPSHEMLVDLSKVPLLLW